MKCIQYVRFGPAADVLTLTEMPTPDPSAGEVLVELTYSGVNPSDVKARGGTRPGVTKPPFDTIIPHSDGAGRIVAVGDGVPSARIGQRVWIWNGQWQRPHGTAASHICVPSEQAVDLPDHVSDQTGAVLGIPGLTAAHAVFGSGAVKGQTVLVQGGAGTVGFLAVQLAKWGGAHVIATARGAATQRVKDAGADVVLDYADSDLAAKVLEANAGREVDRVVEVELGHNIDVDAAMIAPNGTIAVYGSALNMTPTLPFGPLLFKAVTLDILLIYLLPKAERDAAIAALHAALGDGALTCPIAEVFPLDQTFAAHEAVERGGRDGAILVEVRA